MKTVINYKDFVKLFMERENLSYLDPRAQLYFYRNLTDLSYKVNLSVFLDRLIPEEFFSARDANNFILKKAKEKTKYLQNTPKFLYNVLNESAPHRNPAVGYAEQRLVAWDELSSYYLLADEEIYNYYRK